MRPGVTSKVVALSVVVILAGCSQRNVPTQLKSAGTVAAKNESVKQQGVREQIPVKVRGIYLTGWTAGTEKHFSQLLDLADRTEINAMVIDVKDTDGVISYKSDIPLAKQFKLSFPKMKPEKVMPVLEEHHIFPIARIACFKDPELAKKRPDLAIQTASGGLWRDGAGSPWLNPYKRENWEYIAAIAKEAVKKGFKEIQIDYVRFASEGRMGTAVFPEKNEDEPTVVISNFIKYLRKEIEPLGVPLSADIFGLTALVKHDMGIGQKIHGIAANVDYICPMVYPSHYNPGEYGIPNPDIRPYKTVWLSIRDAKRRIAGTRAKIRPWLQDFSLQSRYGPAEVRTQIQAVYDNGIDEWILWNPRNKYTASALRTDDQAAKLDKIHVRLELPESEMTPREKAAAKKRAEAREAAKSKTPQTQGKRSESGA